MTNYNVKISIEINGTDATNAPLFKSFYAPAFEDEFIQFVILAAAQNKGTIKLSSVLLLVNGLKMLKSHISNEQKKYLHYFGKYDAKTRVFELNMAKYERYKDYLDYNKPIQTDVSNYHLGIFLFKVLVVTLGFIFWKDQTIILLFIYLFFKFIGYLNRN